MQEEVFADAIGEIHVTNNVVRIDFVSLSPTEHDLNNNPKTVFRQRIIMPLEAFGNSAELIRRAMDSLIKSGALKQQTPTTQAASSTKSWNKPTLNMSSGSPPPLKPPPLKKSTVDFIPTSPTSPNFSLA